MSKINSIRIINLNYNNNAIKIDDEYFEINGESTLFSLQNGGGKSVLVQMIMSPFVHRRYRHFNERPFESYFTSGQPTFILVEWKLDGQAGFVLTGLMIRKNQEASEEDEALDITSLVHEYSQSNPFDIRNLPVIEVNNEQKKLLGYHQCRKKFEELKQKKGLYFNYYDMSNGGQQRNYFDKLREFQINYKEWESIIKKVNLKESGLSELFRDAKDEAGLVEKWFLGAVEDKLNKDEDRIRSFETLVEKYIRQYKENQSKIERRGKIIKFQSETAQLNERSVRYCSRMEEKSKLEDRIGELIFRLGELLKQKDDEKISLDEILNSLHHGLTVLFYEEDSMQIYSKMDEIYKKETEVSQVEKDFNKIEIQLADITNKQNILKCASYYAKYVSASKALQDCENALDIAKSKRENLIPERNDLGYTLHKYYKQKQTDLNLEIQGIEDAISLAEQESKEQQDLINKLQRQQEVDREKLTGLKKDISYYDNDERRFNERFQENLSRNILGQYENGMFTRIMALLNKDLVEKEKSRKSEKSRCYDIDRMIEEENRNSEECKVLIGSLGQEKKEQQEKKDYYESQLEERRPILQYLSMTEDEIFLTEEMVQRFDTKIEEADRTILKCHLEYEEIDKEYRKLQSGQMIELPEGFVDALEGSGLQYIYGMDWLKMNKNSFVRNQELIKKNPFIPYGIIMSQKEIQKLEELKIDVFTSFPIPIIQRENLESEKNADTLRLNDSIGFYILFNQQLLDKEQLEEMLLKLQKKLEKQRQFIRQREDDKRFYQNKQDILKKHTISKELYQNNITRLDEIEDALHKQQDAVSRIKELCDKLLKEKDKREEVAAALSQEIIHLTDKHTQMDTLQKQYEDYLAAMDERQYYERLIGERHEELESHQERAAEAVNRISERRLQRGDKKRDSKDIASKLRQYISYMEGTLIRKDIEDIESRYDAITNQVDADQKILEEQNKQARERFEQSEDELLYYSKQLRVEEKAYKQTDYDRYEEERLKQEHDESEKNSKDITAELIEKRTEAEFLQKDLDNKKHRFIKKYGNFDLMPKDQIIERKLEDEKTAIQVKIEELSEQLKKLQENIMLLESNLSFLAEYSNLIFSGQKEIAENLEGFSKKEWDKFRGELIRDYKAAQYAEQEERRLLAEALTQLMNVSDYQDEFYHKPIERLYELREMPYQLIEQLNIISRSYENLLEKLEVDIALLNQEKEGITELLLDYINDIHRSLGKIDQNSSITIRDRTVRMLRIKLADWKEKEGIFRERVNSYLDEVLSACLSLIDENEQVGELLGKQITTKNLYDRVCGIGNVLIQLYKIEEQREYPISWKEVARNSGGEGFLSAFVILSSLLSFMRRDETDVFFEKEESKVLIMDNPFAQTNAVHLLKPMMEIAKKTNTQLLCLSGLGGDSIYNRFDQIYVLNLIPSSLKRGMHYLKSEHTKGDQTIHGIISTKIHVEDMEQTALDLF